MGWMAGAVLHDIVWSRGVRRHPRVYGTIYVWIWRTCFVDIATGEFMCRE